METLEQIEKRMSEIKEEINNPECDIDALETEVTELEERKVTLIANAEKREALLDKVAKGEEKAPEGEKFEEEGEPKMEERNILETKAYRSAFLKKLQGAKLDEKEERALTTASDSAGAVIPTSTLDKVDTTLEDLSTLYREVDVLNIPGNLKISKEDTVNDASWVAEGTASTNSADKLGSVSFGAHTLIKTISITAQVSAMSVDAFEKWLVSRLADKMIVAIENAIINGDGSDKPLGILNTTDLVKVTYDNGGVPDYDDMCALMSKISSANKRGAKLVMSTNTLWTKVASMTTTEGKPVFVPDTNNGFAGKLLGVPVIENDAVTDGKIVFGNFKKFTVNFSQGIEIAMDKSVEFNKGNKVYRAMALLDGKVVNVKSFAVLEEAQA